MQVIQLLIPVPPVQGHPQLGPVGPQFVVPPSGPQFQPPQPNAYPPGPTALPVQPGPQVLPQPVNIPGAPPNAPASLPVQPGPFYPQPARPGPPATVPGGQPPGFVITGQPAAPVHGCVLLIAGPGSNPMPSYATGSGAPQYQQPLYNPNYQCPDNSVPTTQSVLTKCGIPLGVTCTPYAENDAEFTIPVVDWTRRGVIRCKKCRTYLNPFVQFVENGRRWRCNVCGFPNEVPSDYWAELDAHGQRVDLAERPELTHGCVEIIAPSEYMVRAPMPPAYLFVIEATHFTVNHGIFAKTVEAIKNSLPTLPGRSRRQVGFITFDSSVHFYSINPNRPQPQMFVVSDVDDIFTPLPLVPNDMVVTYADCKEQVHTLLDRLPAIHKATQQGASAFGAALKAAFSLVQATGARIVCFVGSLPSVGVGKLPLREDPKKFGTDGEVELLAPVSSSFYKDLALDCNRQQTTIDLFTFPQKYIDLGTLGILSQITGGSLHAYPYFNYQVDGDGVERDINAALCTSTGWEAVLRIRASKGLQVSQHFGNYFIRSTDLLSLPSITPDKSFAGQLTINEAITTKTVAVQAALLYTTSNGERRIRVLTKTLIVTDNIAELFKSADNTAVVNLVTKLAMEKALTTRLADAREALVNKVIEILGSYRSHAGSSTGTQQLVLPDTLRFLPLYVLALVKHVACRQGNDTKPDDRSFALYRIRSLGGDALLSYLYPKMYPLLGHNERFGQQDPETGRYHLPQPVQLQAEKVNHQNIYLLDDGLNSWLWVGKQVHPGALTEIFGVDQHVNVPPAVRLTSHSQIPNLTTSLNEQVREIVEATRQSRQFPGRCFVVREGDPLEHHFFIARLVEDKHRGVFSYYEFLVQLQRQLTKA